MRGFASKVKQPPVTVNTLGLINMGTTSPDNYVHISASPTSLLVCLSDYLETSLEAHILRMSPVFSPCWSVFCNILVLF